MICIACKDSKALLTEKGLTTHWWSWAFLKLQPPLDKSPFLSDSVESKLGPDLVDVNKINKSTNEIYTSDLESCELWTNIVYIYRSAYFIRRY